MKAVTDYWLISEMILKLRVLFKSKLWSLEILFYQAPSRLLAKTYLFLFFIQQLCFYYFLIRFMQLKINWVLWKTKSSRVPVINTFFFLKNLLHNGVLLSLLLSSTSS